MLEQLRKRALQQWQALTGKMSTARKIGLVSLLLVAVAGIVTALIYAAQPDFRVIFSDLDSESMSRVIASLDELKVPYRLSGGGRAIAVPAERAEELRVVLAQTAGSPPAPEDELSVTTTPRQQEHLLKQRLELALVRTINRLEDVESSDVHLNIPEPSVFVERQIAPSASVTLTTRRRRPLGPEEGYVVANIVSGAVAGMEPERVKVVDARGVVIWPDRGGAGGLLDRERNLEESMQAQLTRQLEQVVGQGHASVVVDVELDGSRSETVSDHVDPETVPQREETVEEVRQGAPGGPGGVAGTPNAAGGAQGMVAVGLAGGNSSRRQAITDYALSKEKRTVIQDAGKVKWISVSARVSGTFRPAEEGKEPEYVPLSADKMEQMRKLIAVVLRPDRGDRFELVDLALAEPPPLPAEELPVVSWIFRALPYLIPLIIALLLGLLVLKPLVRFLTRTVVEPEVLPPEEVKALPEGEKKPEDVIELGQGSVLEFLREYAQQDPERTALALGRWLRKA